MKKRVLSFILNGESFSCYADIGVTLSDTLSHNGDGRSNIVLVDGVAVNAELQLTLDVEGCNVYTFDGLCEHRDMQNLISQVKAAGIYDRCGCVDNILMVAVPLLCGTLPPTRAMLSGAFNGLLCQKIKFDEVISAIEKAYISGMFRFIVKKSPTSAYRIETLDPKQTHKMTIMLPEAVGVDLAETPIKIASTPVALTPRNTTVQDVDVSPVAPQDYAKHIEPAPEPEPAPPIINEQPVEPISEPEQAQMPPQEEPQTLEPVETDGAQTIATPVSIFDEGFIDSMEKGEAIKVAEPKPKEKTGFFSKFTAAFKDRHHKTLELPDVEE